MTELRTRLEGSLRWVQASGSGNVWATASAPASGVFGYVTNFTFTDFDVFHAGAYRYAALSNEWQRSKRPDVASRIQDVGNGDAGRYGWFLLSDVWRAEYTVTIQRIRYKYPAVHIARHSYEWPNGFRIPQLMSELYVWPEGTIHLWTGTATASAAIAYAKSNQSNIAWGWDTRPNLSGTYRHHLTGQMAQISIGAAVSYDWTFWRIANSATSLHMHFRHSGVNGSAGIVYYSGVIDSIAEIGGEDQPFTYTLAAHFNVWSGYGGYS
jgi:hypothetical protein